VIIPPLVVDSAIFGEATGKRISVLHFSAARYSATGSGTSRAMLFSLVQLHSQKFRRILAN